MVWLSCALTRLTFANASWMRFGTGIPNLPWQSGLAFPCPAFNASSACTKSKPLLPPNRCPDENPPSMRTNDRSCKPSCNNARTGHFINWPIPGVSTAACASVSRHCIAVCVSCTIATKKSRIAKERSPEKRAAFQEAIARIEPERLVFLDESGFSLSLYQHYGWSPRNERCVEAVPFVRGTNLSVLGAYSLGGMVALTSKVGAFKREPFEQFLQECLLPKVTPGCVLVLDNARIHHGGQIAALVKQVGCSLLYLPPYSPDFSPIELVWSWVKHKVRAVGPRDETTRQQAVAEAVQAIPPEFAASWFRKCGYLQS